MTSYAELTAPNGVKYTQPIGLFINNEFVSAADGATLPTIDPSNAKEITSVSSAGTVDVDRAIKAAREAFENPEWREMDSSARGKLLLKLADLVEENAEVIATIETWDAGHTWNDAFEGDIPEFVNTIRYYGGWADKLHGQTIPIGPNRLAYTVREPVGVCAQIIPWNFPLGMASWKLGPALACGNTVVLKPSEQTPLSILFVASLIKEAGFPAGVVNIVNGPGSITGAHLSSHMGVDKIAFTGSTATARSIMKSATINLKNITLETGGKSPFLVFADADIQQAAKWACLGIMSNAGQICTASSRLLVHEDVRDSFSAAFKAEVAESCVLGDPFDKTTSQGPQISELQYKKVLSYMDSARSEGATLLMGGSAAEIADGKGYFIKSTAFTDVTPSMKVYREEIFGPFAVITSFSTDDEALKLANDTEYGLGASIFTADMARAHKLAAKVQSGMVWINSTVDSDYRCPFGGVKMSGIGRELGEAGLHAYTNEKAIYVNLGNNL